MKTLTLAAALLVPPALHAQEAPKRSAEETARLEAARAEARRAVAAKADDADAWRRLGRLEQALGEAGAARDAYREAVRLDPADAGTWSLLALSFEKLKENDQAVAAWESCLSKAKDPALAAVARKHLSLLRLQ